MPTRFKLNTGAYIPAVGFGTWQDEHAQEKAVEEAINAGYHHIDTAQAYGTEKPVGKGIRKSGIAREQLFVTSKLWNNCHHPDDVPKSLQNSLDDLGLDYVDAFLIHWPVAWKRGSDPFPKDANGNFIMEDIDWLDTWKAMEKLLKTGKTKAIGVSNFSRPEMERLIENASVQPAIHQFEGHPWLQQREFADWNKSKGIHITHYSPFGNQNELYSNAGHIGKLIDEPILNEIGQKHNKNPAQVALAWAISNGYSVLPKSKTPARIKSNLEGDFKLDSDDLKKIETIDRKLRFNDSSGTFGRDFFQGLEGTSV